MMMTMTMMIMMVWLIVNNAAERAAGQLPPVLKATTTILHWYRPRSQSWWRWSWLLSVLIISMMMLITIVMFRSNFTKKKLKLVSTGLWEWFLLKTNWISHWSDCSTHHICPRRIINSVILMRCKKNSKMILIANLKKKIGSATNSRRTPVQWSESEESSRVWSSCSVVCICLGTVGHNW